MRFYAVCTDAIELTHAALQRVQRTRQGSRRPSRSLRVAQLYGHLQCRAREGKPIQVGIRGLAQKWHLQPRELRADLNDLQAMGWLSFQGGLNGTIIQLHGPGVAGAPEVQQTDPDPEEEWLSEVMPEKVEPSTELAETTQALVRRFAEIYNWMRPEGWAFYQPEANDSITLGGRLEQALRHAGGEEALWRQLQNALIQVPPLVEHHFHNAHSGAQCAGLLLQGEATGPQTDVSAWNVFQWAKGATDPTPQAGMAPPTRSTDSDAWNDW